MDMIKTQKVKYIRLLLFLKELYQFLTKKNYACILNALQQGTSVQYSVNLSFHFTSSLIILVLDHTGQIAFVSL